MMILKQGNLKSTLRAAPAVPSSIATSNRKGRKPTAREKAPQVTELLEKGVTKQSIADQLGIGIASVYRIIKRQRAA